MLADWLSMALSSGDDGVKLGGKIGKIEMAMAVD
jgi:hypothetical protein